MKKTLLFLIVCSLYGQSPPTPEPTHPTLIPVSITVNWPPRQLVEEKYGPLPKWAIFGELVGCNLGEHNITFGEGEVITALRRAMVNFRPGEPFINQGLQAFSIQDALSLVANAQNASVKNYIVTMLKDAANSTKDAKALGYIGGGPGAGVGIVLGGNLLNLILKNSNSLLTLRQVIQYSKDGMQTVMSVAAGRCTPPLSVLFATPGKQPATSTDPGVALTLNVPQDR